jgi:Leucine-rich repeat (LRR) protein
MLNLEELNISDNKISRLPYGIGLCRSLKKLIIGMDHTIKIPCESILRTCADDAQVMSLLEHRPSPFSGFFPSPMPFESAIHFSLYNPCRIFPDACEFITSPATQVCVRYMFELHEAAQTNRLHLNGFTIPAIPAEVIELENLTELNMSGSNLSNVVSEIDKIKGLKLVDFSYNRIKLLPPTIGKLKRLEMLNVQVCLPADTRK